MHFILTQTDAILVDATDAILVDATDAMPLKSSSVSQMSGSVFTRQIYTFLRGVSSTAFHKLFTDLAKLSVVALTCPGLIIF